MAGSWPEKLFCEEGFGSDDLKLGNLAVKASKIPACYQMMLMYTMASGEKKKLQFNPRQ